MLRSRRMGQVEEPLRVARSLFWLGEPTSDHELPPAPPRGFRGGVLGWSRIEDGERDPPEWPFATLSRALVAGARLSFPVGLRRPFALGLLPGSFRWRLGHHFVFRHATDAPAAEEAFAALHFDWSLRASVLFLSAPAAPPPRLARRDLERALAAVDGRELLARGIDGVVCPGSDGDVAGVYATEERLAMLVRALAPAAAEAGAALVIAASPAELRERLAAAL